MVGFIDYENGKLIRFVESYDLESVLKYNEKIESYHEYQFNTDPVFVIDRVFAADMFSDGRVWEKISKMKKR